MIISRIVKDVFQYITEGFIEIFSPNKDRYPAVGLQPYGGTVSHYKY